MYRFWIIHKRVFRIISKSYVHVVLYKEHNKYSISYSTINHLLQSTYLVMDYPLTLRTLQCITQIHFTHIGDLYKYSIKAQKIARIFQSIRTWARMRNLETKWFLTYVFLFKLFRQSNQLLVAGGFIIQKAVIFLQGNIPCKGRMCHSVPSQKIILHPKNQPTTIILSQKTAFTFRI